MKPRPKMIIRIICLVSLSICIIGCTRQQNNRQMTSKRDQISKEIRPFQADYFKDATRRHVAVFFEVKEGKLESSTRPAEVRPGNMPYRSKVGGGVMIRYADESGKVLGQYFVENPIMARTCDFDYDGVGDVSPMEGAIVEILLPFQAQLTSLEVMDSKEHVIKLDMHSYRELIRKVTSKER